MLLTEEALVANERNKVHSLDAPIHCWYRFVLAYPPHLVRTYLDRFDIKPGQTVLDPFCGTGTTVLECRKLGINSVGTEGNAVVQFAGTVKLDWSPDPDELLAHAQLIADATLAQLKKDGVSDDVFFTELTSTEPRLLTLPAEEEKLLLTNSVSPRPMHKVLRLREQIQKHADDRFTNHERLALADALIWSISNLRFGPEVGLGKIKPDAAVVEPWLQRVRTMAKDLRQVKDIPPATAIIHLHDSRGVSALITPGSLDAVITSPPYPNEKDYTRTTRLESVLLGFVTSKEGLRELKRRLLRSNTRGIYKGDADDEYLKDFPQIEALAKQIDDRRIELGKTSGFEKLYGRVVRLYFGVMAKHFSQLRPLLKPGARLAYVVGDQASFFQIMIRTGQLLAEVAQGLGYEVESIDLFRTRAATATRAQLREEVVVLRWPGPQTT